MNAAEKEPEILKQIKNHLRAICQESLLILPADKVAEHPLVWLESEMEQVLQALRNIKSEIESRAEKKRAEVVRLEKERAEYRKALEKSNSEETLAICKNNLCVREQMLRGDIKELQQEHEKQREEFSRKTQEIRRLNREIEKADTQKILEYTGVVHKKHINEAGNEVARLEERLEEVKKETKKKIDGIEKNLERLGIPEQPHSAMMEQLKEIEEYIEKRRGKAELREKDAGAVKKYTPYEARTVHAAVEEIEHKGTSAVRALEERLEVLKKRVKTDAGGAKSPEEMCKTAIAERIFALQKQVEEMEKIYKTQIREIMDASCRKIREYTKKIEAITGVQKKEVLYPEIEGLSHSEQERCLSEAEHAAAALGQEHAILENIEAFIRERKELLEKMSMFEEQASDPGRLFRSSFQLISEEKFRKMAVPTLFRVEKEIFALSEQHRDAFGREPLIKARAAVQEIQEEISHRIINSNVFMIGKNKK